MAVPREPAQLVRHSHDGLLVRFAHHQTSVLRGQRAFCHARGVGALARDVADSVVALGSAPRLAFARALKVAQSVPLSSSRS